MNHTTTKLLVLTAGLFFLASLVPADLSYAAKPPAGPKTIYVDAANVDDRKEDGSEGHPFDMIQEGIDAALAYDTVLVRDGVYTEEQRNSNDYGVYPTRQVLLVLKPNVAVRAENIGGAVIDGGNNSLIQAAVMGFYKGHVTDGNYEPMEGAVFDGFVIRNYHGSALWFFNLDASINPTPRPPAAVNEITGCTILGLGAGISGGINLYYTPARVAVNEIRDCGMGIGAVGSATERYVIDGNRIDAAESGIQVGGFLGEDVYNNIVTGFTNFGIKVSYANAVIVNNTVADGTGPGITGDNEGAGNTVIKNNILANCGGGGVDRFSVSSRHDIDYNVYWNNGADRTDELGNPVPLAANEFNDQDPLLDVAYHIGELSPCVDWGTDYSALFCHDTDGDPRCLADGGDGLFDAGADEYMSLPSCTDGDGDGYFAEPGCGTEVDCDDGDDTVNPGMNEKGSRKNDGLDNDCNGVIDG